MARSLPLLKQTSEDNCALACLRMVLAGRGTLVTEAELEQRVRKDVGGTDIEELERLATSFGLIASAQDATAHQIRALLDAETDVILSDPERFCTTQDEVRFACPAGPDCRPNGGGRRDHGGGSASPFPCPD